MKLSTLKSFTSAVALSSAMSLVQPGSALADDAGHQSVCSNPVQAQQQIPQPLDTSGAAYVSAPSKTRIQAGQHSSRNQMIVLHFDATSVPDVDIAAAGLTELGFPAVAFAGSAKKGQIELMAGGEAFGTYSHRDLVCGRLGSAAMEAYLIKVKGLSLEEVNTMRRDSFLEYREQQRQIENGLSFNHD